MSWEIRYLPEAVKDMKALAGNQQLLVAKALKKVSANPLPENEGGYGKPLGNHSGSRLSGLMKIKIKSAGLRVVYQIVRTQTQMLIVVVGARADEAVYLEAEHRAEKHGLK